MGRNGPFFAGWEATTGSAYTGVRTMDAQNRLSGKRVAVVATDGFEQSELVEPKKALERAGAKVDVISLNAGAIRGWAEKQWGSSVPVDRSIASADAEEYDALV